MRPSIQNVRKLLNRRTVTLLGVGLLLLAAVAANVIMNRTGEGLTGAEAIRTRTAPAPRRRPRISARRVSKSSWSGSGPARGEIGRAHV